MVVAVLMMVATIWYIYDDAVAIERVPWWACIYV